MKGMARECGPCFFIFCRGLSPCGGTISFRACEKKWQKKSRAKGDTLLCPPWQSPHLKQVRGADVRRSALQLHGLSKIVTSVGPRRCTRRWSLGAQPRLRSAAALERLFSIFLFAEKYGPRRASKHRPMPRCGHRGPQGCGRCRGQAPGPQGCGRCRRQAPGPQEWREMPGASPRPTGEA